MTIIGHWTNQTATKTLPESKHIVDNFTLGYESILTKVSIYCKTNGSQSVTGVLYNVATKAKIAETETITPMNAGWEWVDLRMASPINIPAGGYYVGVTGHAVANGITVGIDSSSGNYVIGKVGSGALEIESETAGTLMTTATTADIWARPEEDDLSYGRLPWELAQSAFAGAGGKATEAVCGWHGTKVDPETGSFALVDAEGPLSGLVGDRIKVTRGLRSVYLFVKGFASLEEEDLSLTRRAFLELGPLAATDLRVNVAVVT